MTTRRSVALLAAAALTFSLAACGEETTSAEPEPSAQTPSETSREEPSEAPSEEPTEPESPSPSEPAEPEGVVLKAVIKGGEITPNAKRVDVPLGEEFTLEITSDQTGELHVHSIPDRYIDFGPGTTEATVTIDTPGLVEVEEHNTGILLWSLRVQ